MTVNKTDIVFDADFKDQIHNYKNTNESILNSLIISKERNIAAYNVFSLNLISIREHIMLSCFPKIPKTHPNHFAVMVSLLVDITDCTNWQDVMKLYKNCYNCYDVSARDVIMDPRQLAFNFIDGFSGFDLFKAKCACAHDCQAKNLNIFTNQLNNRSIVIGSECINKHKIMTRTELKRFKKTYIESQLLLRNNAIRGFQSFAKRLRANNDNFKLKINIPVFIKFLQQYQACPCKDCSFSRTKFYVRPLIL